MATLISPGVSVTVTDDSFYVPAAAATVPLFFVATMSEKSQPNGDPALSTYEHSTVRTITSQAQSVRNYGIPFFRTDVDGFAHHGDARNEYGLFALNQFLGIGNQAYVVRANVNLNDDRGDILDLWNKKTQASTIIEGEEAVATLGCAYILESLINSYIAEYNADNGLVVPPLGSPLIGSPASGYKVTVDTTELATLINEALDIVFGTYVVGNTTYFAEATFARTRPDFVEPTSSLLVYEDGYDMPSTDTFLGLNDARADWVSSGGGSVIPEEWTALEARNFFIEQSELFQYTVEFYNKTSLGANDAARRTQIVTALSAAINSNTEVRSEKYEYNLIICPGYYEDSIAVALNQLASDIDGEAFVIGDVPMNKTTEDTVTWMVNDNSQRNTNSAYYYPHGLATNLDGTEVMCSSSGIALRTIVYNDNVAEVWSAPAGVRRGVITGIAALGYYTGVAGTPTTFVENNLNTGDMDTLYLNSINPLLFKPGLGMLVWGQKTATSTTSALDRINVARLICYMKRRLRKAAIPFVFEPNDQLTRDSFKAAVDGFLGNIVIKRGLYDFATLCDDTNNTPFVIDNNQMILDVAIKPVKAAEFIFVPIRVVSTGAEI